MGLQIRNLSKTYPNGVEALKEVAFTVLRGMYGLLGPNGAGKSTLMRTLATLQEPDAGSVRLGDIDVLAGPGRVRDTLGSLPQEFGVYPKVSAEELLGHFAALKGITGRWERREVVEALLRQVNRLWGRHYSQSYGNATLAVWRKSEVRNNVLSALLNADG